MMFKLFEFNSRTIGFGASIGRVFYFLGNKYLKKEMLAHVFPAFDFCFLNQVHGNAIVKADSSSLLTADGHYSQTLHKALVIQTADCLPLLLGCESWVAAVHAGWRGIEKRILRNCLQALEANGLELTATDGSYVIGAHIRKTSFEVSKNIADAIASVYPGPKADVVLKHSDPTKRYVDLTKIAVSELTQGPVRWQDCLVQEDDTFVSDQYWSYRREKQAAQRQYSFVVLTDLQFT